MAENNEENNEVSGSRIIRRPFIISVEGNIGSGKSTFLEFCRDKPGVAVYPEPVDKWQNVNGVNLLANFYADPRRWALAFQLHVGETMLAQYAQKTWKGTKFIERSLLSSRHCFMESMRQNGTLDATSAHVLDNWYDRVLGDHKARPHAIVYLRTSPLSAYNRMRGRARPEEGSVTMGYITELHELHERWMASIEAANLSGESDLPTYYIHADLPKHQLWRQYERCISDLEMLNL